MTDDRSRFHPLFESWARRVRARLALRHALSGAAIGLAVAIVPAGVAWKTRHGDLRPLAPLLGVIGAGAGLAIAKRKRWSDTDVALYLDERLATDETITTAVELRNGSELDDPTRAVVVTNAASALIAGDAKKMHPRLWKPAHAVAPIAIAALVVIARAPLPPAPQAATPPGSTQVQMTEIDGLKRVIAIGQIAPRDDEQKKRLEKLAQEADKLKNDLAHGIPKREAQDRIAHLRDEIAAERLTLGEGEQRAGMEAAQSKLQESDRTSDAAKALGDHDLEKLDKEMEKLANQREKTDRDLAKKKLDEAIDAAKKGGAPDVAKALENEKKHLEASGARADKLKELADAMKGSGLESDDIEQKSEALDRSGSDKDAKQLADAMRKGLENLTPEERKRLADKLKAKAKEHGLSQGDAQDLKDLADELSSPEGQKKLEDELKDLANEDDESDESKRQKQLDDAENGAGDAEKDIDKHGQQGQGGQPGDKSGDGEQGPADKGQGSGQEPGQGQGPSQGQGHGHVPIPIPMDGDGKGNGSGGKGGKGTGGPGTHDTGTGDHSGSTDAVGGDTLKSRAHGKLNKGTGLPGSQTGYLPGKAGGTAKTQGTGGLKAAAPSEVDGVDKSDVPQEYRDQVKQYFNP